MAHYFFDLSDGDKVVEDKIGVDLTDVPAARERATALAVGISQRQAAVDPYDSRELHVRAAAGRCVAKIAFRYISM